uniref:Ion transport domain-containing protein n=1 Tax=Buteo japonicus TaxID=224669 RepID=A0A8C0BTL5_9AVES
DLHHLHRRHLPGCGDHLPLPVVLGYLFLSAASVRGVWQPQAATWAHRLLSPGHGCLLRRCFSTTELLLKLYADPITCWKSGSNISDAAVLLIAFLPHVLPHLPHLEITHLFFLLHVFTETLGQTVQTVMYALILLLLLMFVFAILGHGWYGDPKTGDAESWGSLKAALFMLVNLVTVSTAAFSSLSQANDKVQILEWFTSSHVFIVMFILLGNFIIFNKLIALLITRAQVIRTLCIECAGRKITRGEDFSELLDDIKKTLRHSNVIITEGLCFTVPFIDLYLPFLDLQDDTLNRLQHHYYEHTGILREIVEVMKEKSLPDHEKIKS